MDSPEEWAEPSAAEQAADAGFSDASASPPAAASESTQFDHAAPANTGAAVASAHLAGNRTATAMLVLRLVTMVAALAVLVPVVAPAQLAYSVCLTSALVTSLLRLHQRLPTPQLSRQYAATLMLEDASHYMLFSLIFLFTWPASLPLVPVALFAALHSASYGLRVLNLLGPGSCRPVRLLISVVEKRSQTLLLTIAVCELLLMPYTLLMLFLGRGNLLAPFVYYRFLTLRYASRRNPYSRTVFSQLRGAVEGAADDRRCPTPVAAILRRAVRLVTALALPVMPAGQ